MQKRKLRNKFFRHLGKVGVALGSAIIMTGQAQAVDTTTTAATKVLGQEGGKEALNQALKIARTKPVLSIATLVTCLACPPVAGVAASPALCVACGILIAKGIG